MRFAPKGADWRLLAGPGIGVGLSVVGFHDASTVEQIVFGVTAAGSLAWGGYEVWSAQRYIESKPIRRRCHRVLEQVAKTVFPNDATLQITVFLPRTSDGEPTLVPVVRYWRNRPDAYKPSSKCAFTPHSSLLITQAWEQPGRMFGHNIPSHQWSSLDDEQMRGRAQGWYQAEMGMPPENTKQLSEWTLRKVASITVVGLKVPYLHDTKIGLVSFSSEHQDLGKMEPGPAQALGQYLEAIAMMLAPMP